MPDPIAPLVERCRQGEDAAITELIGLFADQVLGLCLRMLGHRQDAEDAAQESMVRAIRSLDRWDNRRDFRPWLFAIAGNRCRTWLSHRQRRPVPSAEMELLADPRDSSAEAASWDEELEAALARLRPEYRQSFVFFHRQQMSYSEIAAALDVPLGTVRTWVHRARHELAERLLERGMIEESSHALRRI